MSNELVAKSENALALNQAMPAGLDGAGSGDFLMPRFKIWHPMSKQEVPGAKLGLWYDGNTSSIAGDTLRFYLLSQKNTSYTDDEGRTKNYKNLLVAKESQLDIPAEIVLSAAGLRAAKGLNTALMEKALTDKNQNTFAYLIEAKIEITQNDKGKYGVPKFSIVGSADGDTFDKLARLHAENATAYTLGKVGGETTAVEDPV